MRTSFTPSEPLEVFISYASKDEDLVQEFKPNLEGLERQKVIKTFYGSDTPAGFEWRKEIRKQINSAQLILLLVSKHFLASECCYEFELDLALKRYETGAARVVSIILSPCNWADTQLSEFQVLPKGGKPVDSWKNTSEAFAIVTHEIIEVVKHLKAGNGPTRLPPETPIVTTRTVGASKYAVIVGAIVIALASLFGLRSYFPWSKSPGEEQFHIEVTDLPPYGMGGRTSQGHIAGTVSGAKSPEFNVVIYSFTDAWYVQPYTNDPETRIGSDGRWSADIKTGTRYAVLLVPGDYQAPSPVTTNPTRLNGVLTSIEFEGKR